MKIHEGGWYISVVKNRRFQIRTNNTHTTVNQYNRGRCYYQTIAFCYCTNTLQYIKRK